MSELAGLIRVAYAAACRETADAAHHLVGGVAERRNPGDLIRDARLLRVRALAALDRAVLVELAAGSDWEDIGDALGMTPRDAWRRYQETFDLWASGRLDVGALGDEGLGLPCDQRIDDTALALDDWHARHAEPWSEQVSRPVSSAL